MTEFLYFGFYHNTHQESLREKFPNTEFFLVRIQENTDQKNSVYGHFSRSEFVMFPINYRAICQIVTVAEIIEAVCQKCSVKGDVN